MLNALLIMLGLTALGAACAIVVQPRFPRLLLLAAAFPLGAGLFTWLLFMFSSAGVLLTATSQLVIWLSLFLATVLTAAFRSNREYGSLPAFAASFRSAARPFQDLTALLLVAALTAWAVYLAVSRSYSTWDAMGIWAIKGMGIAREGSILAAGHWGSHDLQYPLNIPLQISTFLLSGASLAASKVLFPAYYAALCLACYSYFRQEGGWRPVLATLFIASIPILFEHATIGYTNLAFTTYLVLGILSLAGKVGGGWQSGLMAGIFFGLAAWTRPEGVFLLAAGLLVVLLTRTRARLAWWSVLIPCGLLILPWQIYSSIHTEVGLASSSVQAALRAWGSGQFNLSALYWILRFATRQVIEPTIWGLTAPAILVLGLSFWKRRRTWFQRPDLGFLVGVGLGVLTYFYLVSFSQDLTYLLGTSVNRIFMPVWVLGLVALWGMMFDPAAELNLRKVSGE